MRIACVADCHLGNHKQHGGPTVAGLNLRCRQAMDVLSRATARAQALRVDVFAVLGDLFDSDRPEPQVIAAAQDALACFSGPKLLLLGNHDMFSMAEGDHALGPLHGFGAMQVVEKPYGLTSASAQLLFVPFQPGPASAWFPKAVAQAAASVPHSTFPRVLLFHLGIKSEGTPPWLRDAHDAVELAQVADLCVDFEVDAALAGNWHARQRWPGVPEILQVGALVPTGWDNPGEEGYGTLALYDTTTRTLTCEELSGPRFLTLRTPQELQRARQLSDMGMQVYARFPADGASAVIQARELLAEGKENGWLAGGDLVLGDTEAKAQARTAATVARKSETLEQALAGYVAQMPLPDSVARAEVLARARRYLGS